MIRMIHIRSAVMLTVLALTAHAEIFEPAPGCRIECVRIESGEFTQGSPESETGRKPDETRRHVTLTRPFLIGKTPVTRGQFAAFVSATGYRTEAERGKSGGYGVENGALVQRPAYNWRNPGFAQTNEHPAVIVTFADARAFCAWLSVRTGRTFTLPTEARREYVALAGAPPVENPAECSWHAGNSDGTTHPVALKPANTFGLTDITGHVGEWCLDWYGPRGTEAVVDPTTDSPPAGEKPRRVVRGGTFLRPASATRAAARNRFEPGTRNADIGFRVVTEIEKNNPAVTTKNTVTPEEKATAKPPPTHLNSSVPKSTPASTRQNAAAPRAPFSSGIVWLLLPLGAIVFIAAAIITLTRQNRYEPMRRDDSGRKPSPVGTTSRMAPESAEVSSQRQPLRTDSRVSISPEGFWINARTRPRSRIRYRWLSHGEWRDGVATFTPDERTGGHYVFTGVRPESVLIDSIVQDTVTNVAEDWADAPPPLPPDNASRDVGRALGAGYAAGWLSHRHASPPPRPARAWPPAY